MGSRAQKSVGGRKNEGGSVGVLDERGVLSGRCPMSETQIAEAMHWMSLSRAIDDRLIKLQRIGRVGVYGPVQGQEAAVVGSSMALDPQIDWIVPASREQPAMLRHGLPLVNLFAGYMGRVDQAAVPAGVNLLPRQQSIGAQLPHAVGLAWALKIRRLTGVVLVFFGEGASSQGDFHEACNLAGVVQAPIVFVLVNNRYAISTPVQKQSAAPNLASRAEGYGFPGTAVDGNDLFAVYSVAAAAITRAREGGGPSLIECKTYRIGFHNTSDNPKEYRDQAEVSAEMERDPIERLRRYATQAGIWSTELDAKLQKRIREEIDTAQRFIDSVPRPTTTAVFDHVYETPSARFSEQKAEALELERQPPPTKPAPANEGD
jgi:TPP-dependent pyruvate/acetoin dehydrogenase alpha subunit